MEKKCGIVEVGPDTYLLGAEPSPVDPRDFQAEVVFVEETDLPWEYDLRSRLKPVRNQWSQGTCCAMSCAVMKETQDKIDDYFSPQFIYNFRYNQDGPGMYPRDAMKVMNKIGSVPEEEYSYGTIEKPEFISQKIKDKALNYKIKAYAFVNTIQCLKTAIFRNGACLISFPVYHNKGDFWKPQFQGQSVLGFHACAVTGYTSEGFVIRNSWGSKWNGNGYTLFPYKDWGMHCEVWTTIDDNSTSNDPKYTSWYGNTWRYIKNSFANQKPFAILCFVASAASIGISIKENIWALIALPIIWIGFIGTVKVKKSYLKNKLDD